jgi:hypothetical protein
MNDELERIWKAEVVDPINELFDLMSQSEPMKGKWESEETVWRQWLFKEWKKRNTNSGCYVGQSCGWGLR